MPVPPTQYRILSGLCPDEKCQTKLFFPSYDSSIECTNCGQRHERRAIRDVTEVTDSSVALHNMLRSILLGTTAPRKGVEMVKVLGLSNYHCKLLSPLLTYYGMDKKTGKAKPLREITQADTFDCSVLGDRTFLIDPEHIQVHGYGRDISGSMNYLKETLDMVKMYNNAEEQLIPLHADGDGHCLVHAVSRCLVGRELFYHPLRCNLKSHFQQNLDKYKALFRDFIDAAEWPDIIAECDPDFEPADGELLGLRNIHVFGLANVLKRPVILLDSLAGMQSSGDYSAVFLPGLSHPDQCRGKNGELNKPLCLAWSSPGRNHYIPLVGIKKGELPRLPRTMLPKVWGVPQSLMDQYIEFDVHGCCIIGGEKCLQDGYILKLAAAMDELFLKQNAVHPALVADVHHYIYKRTGMVGAKPSMMIAATQKAVAENRLYRCLTCDAVCEMTLAPEWLKPGGALYKMAKQQFGQLKKDKLYSFPMQGVTCTYDAVKDELIFEKQKSQLEHCTWCQGNRMRQVTGDNEIKFRNGDQTKTTTSHCKCGFKHWWDGKEYDNLPQQIPVTLTWHGKAVGEKVAWFMHESDPNLNSNAYEVAAKLVQKHFPGEFGSERLIQKVVDQILEQTKLPEEDIKEEQMGKRRETLPSKIIITGLTTLHKEELGVSETERRLRERLEKHAAEQQKRTTDERGRQKVEKEKAILKSLAKSSPSPPRESAGHSQLQVKEMTEAEAAEESREETSSALQKVDVPKTKVIRIVTSEGKQSRVILHSSATYKDLLQKMELEAHIKLPSIHRILYNFPPQELKPPHDGDAGPLPLQHGDRIQVELVKQPDPGPEPMETEPCSSGAAVTGNSAAALEQELLKRLEDLEKSSQVDSLDTAIASLLLTATLTGRSLWEHAQNSPHLFQRGGLFFQQMERNVGTVDGKHYRPPAFPDKVFRYNAALDIMELCLEPHGHFPVTPGIEDRVRSQSGSIAKQDPPSEVVSTSMRAGSSGEVVKNEQRSIPKSEIFKGKGYTLSGPASRDNSGVESNKHCDIEWQRSMKVIEGAEVDEVVETKPQPEIIRKGPGFSILNPELTNTVNQSVEKVRNLTSLIQMMDPDSSGLCATESELRGQGFSSTVTESAERKRSLESVEDDINSSQVETELNNTETKAYESETKSALSTETEQSVIPSCSQEVSLHSVSEMAMDSRTDMEKDTSHTFLMKADDSDNRQEVPMEETGHVTAESKNISPDYEGQEMAVELTGLKSSSDTKILNVL